MLTSIASGLGIGSGIDTRTLVRDLATNARESRETQIVAKERATSARISAVAALTAGLQALSSDYAESAATTSAADLKTLAKSFVSGFNLLRTSLSETVKAGSTTIAAGALSGEAAARALAYELGRLPQAQLAASGTYTTLSDIGIGINRAGTLTIDTAKFDAALAAQPGEISMLLTATSGLAAALRDINDRMTSPGGPLRVATARYERIAKSTAQARVRLEAENARLVERLTKSFSGMDQQVARLKAVQSYVEQQVAAWNVK
jgi:flagellar hook-associated protein 2